jgi:hypothetical protein
MIKLKNILTEESAMKAIINAKKGAKASGGGYSSWTKIGNNSWKNKKTGRLSHNAGLYDRIGEFSDFVIEGKLNEAKPKPLVSKKDIKDIEKSGNIDIAYKKAMALLKSLSEGKLTEAKDQKLAKLFQASKSANVKMGEDKLYKLSQEWERWNVDNDDKYDDLLDSLFMAVELVQDAGVPGTNNVEDDKEYRMYIKSAEKHLKQFNKDIAKAMKGLNEGLNNGPRADKAIKDLEKIGAQIDYLSDADDATKKIWKKAGVNTEDDNGN